MPIESDTTLNAEVTLAVPGLVSVTTLASGGNLVQLGPAAGWMAPRGLLRWERELSFVARTDMTPELGRTLKATLPHEQIPPRKLPLAYRAVETSPFLALNTDLALDLRKEGVRVHTVGVDRVSAGFYYFAEGGTGEAVHVQGNLVEMLSASLKATSTNAEIAALQEGLVDRLLAFFSNGVVSELAVELADALPRMSKDGTGLLGTHLEVFEVKARALVSRSARWETSARDMVEALAAATSRGEHAARVPLFGDAREQMMRPLKVQIDGQTTTLPARYRWTVSGAPREELKSVEKPKGAQPAPSPRPGPAVPRPAAAFRKRTPEPVTVTGAVAVAEEAPAVAAAPAEARPETNVVAERPAVVEDSDGQPEVAAAASVEEPSGAGAAAAPPPARDEASPRAESGEKAPEQGAEEQRSRDQAGEAEPATPAKAKTPPPKASTARVIFVLLVLAAAMAYLRWHGAMGCFVGGAPHP
jgi:hypothetical protein